MERPEPKCIKCEKTLHRSVCIVDHAGFSKVVYGMISAHYGSTLSGYICDECTTELKDKNILIAE